MSRRRTTGISLAAAAAAALGIAAGWGFTVDDALISTRVAHSLALGNGYRFNPHTTPVDCITPLGWAPLLAPLSRGGPWAALHGASVLGATTWLLAAAWLGRKLATETQRYGWLTAVLVLATSLPLGAWAGAGMETGVVLSLATWALAGRAPGALAAGAAGALRPELVPWAVALALGGAIAARESLRARALLLSLALLPAVGVAALRWRLFGHPAPLSAVVKPSDFDHGLRYVAGALLLSGPPYLLLSRRALRAIGRRYAAVLAALAVHLLILLGVGGDWMPMWRLALPIFPSFILLGAVIADQSRLLPQLFRMSAVVCCAALLHVAHGPAARAVKSARKRISQTLPELLHGARRVATLDVGWVGASDTSLHVIDLAGLTDPHVAYLTGGHTSKRLPDDFLQRRDADALVLLLAPRSPNDPAADARPPPGPARYARAVENRLMQQRAASLFRPTGLLRLSPNFTYQVLRRVPESAASLPARAPAQ